MTSTQRFVLKLCLEHVGMSGLARCTAYARAGWIEARVNWEIARTDRRLHRDKWFQLEAVKDVARRIRKPINEADDYMLPAEHCLRMTRWPTGPRAYQ